MWKEFIIEAGMSLLRKELKKNKDSKIRDFLISEETQKTVTDIARHYHALVEELETAE